LASNFNETKTKPNQNQQNKIYLYSNKEGENFSLLDE